MRILAIDPGPTNSGVCVFVDGKVTFADASVKNDMMLDLVRISTYELLACECIEALYAHVGKETVNTIRLVGRIEEACCHRGIDWCGISPQEVKKRVCGTSAAKDPAVRQALIDRFGGERAIAGAKTCPVCKGRKHVTARVTCPMCEGIKVEPGAKPGTTRKCQSCNGRGTCSAQLECDKCENGVSEPAGPLHGVSSHAWRALAVAVAATIKPGGI